jgi:phage terminase small subunit
VTGPLRNARHEKFVQLLLEGKDATAAHAESGYTRDDANAARLKANPKVRERLAELQNEIAATTRVTTESLIAELEDARRLATNLEQLSAAVRAIESKAKLSGLLVERQKLEVSGSADFPGTTREEITRAMIDDMLRYSTNPYHDVTDADRKHLVAMFIDCSERMDAYVEEIKARPYRTAYQAPKALPSPHANGKIRS